MKAVLAILVLVSMSSTVFAASTSKNVVSKMDGYDCGLQVGKSLAKLASTSVSQDAESLSIEISNYSEQTRYSVSAKTKSDRDIAAQAANNSWQSIVYLMNNIKNVSLDEARLIDTACDLQVVQSVESN